MCSVDNVIYVRPLLLMDLDKIVDGYLCFIMIVGLSDYPAIGMKGNHCDEATL